MVKGLMRFLRLEVWASEFLGWVSGFEVEMKTGLRLYISDFEDFNNSSFNIFIKFGV